MIFFPDGGQHTRGETTNLIRTDQHDSRTKQFLLDTDKPFETQSIPPNPFKTNNSGSFYSIQKRKSIRYKSMLPRAIQLSIYHPAAVISNRQPRRLETNVTHTKQTTATLLNRQLSRSFGLANLTHLPSDLIFNDRNPRA